MAPWHHNWVANEITPWETQLRRMLNPLLAPYEKNIPGPNRDSGSLAKRLPNHYPSFSVSDVESFRERQVTASSTKSELTSLILSAPLKGLALPMHMNYLPAERQISLLPFQVEHSAFLQVTLKLRVIFILVRGPTQHLCIYLGIYTRIQRCADLEMFLCRKKSVLVNAAARNF